MPPCSSRITLPDGNHILCKYVGHSSLVGTRVSGDIPGGSRTLCNKCQTAGMPPTPDNTFIRSWVKVLLKSLILHPAPGNNWTTRKLLRQLKGHPEIRFEMLVLSFCTVATGIKTVAELIADMQAEDLDQINPDILKNALRRAVATEKWFHLSAEDGIAIAEGLGIND